MVMLTKPIMVILSMVKTPQYSLEGADVGNIYGCRENFIPVVDRSCIKGMLTMI